MQLTVESVRELLIGIVDGYLGINSSPLDTIDLVKLALMIETRWR